MTHDHGRIDVHAHAAPPALSGFHDARFPALVIDGSDARLYRGGRAVRVLPPPAVSVDARLEALDAADLRHQVVSPIPPLICDVGDEALDVEWARLVNREIAAWVAPAPDRLSALGIVPLTHPGAAIEVLAEAQQLGMVGVQIDARAGERELDDPDLLEFFQAASELGMLVFVHPVALGAQSNWTPRIDQLELNFGIGLTSDTAIAAARLVFGGTLAASPGLAVCLAHGGGTFPWVLSRIAHLWDETHDATAAELARPVFVDSVVFRDENIRYLVDRLGADRVLFGTDHPMPGCDSLTGGTLAGLDADERALIESGNALGLLPALAERLVGRPEGQATVKTR